jgi:hypothetical protein
MITGAPNASHHQLQRGRNGESVPENRNHAVIAKARTGALGAYAPLIAPGSGTGPEQCAPAARGGRGGITHKPRHLRLRSDVLICSRADRRFALESRKVAPR